MTDTVQTQLLYAPVSGKIIPIEKVPDEVFSKKMVGDGVAVLTQTDILKSPADGIVKNIHSACHALTVTTSSGIDILMHIGLETVSLKGKGFTVYVQKGQRVKKGDTLISFDLEYIRQKAKSPMTVLLITNPERVKSMTISSDKEVVVSQDVVLRLEVKEKESLIEKKDEKEQTALSWAITIINPSGMHARPAGRLASTAKKYKSSIFLINGEKQGDVKSISSLMGLDLKCGDEVRLKAVGKDAIDALKEMIPLLQKGAGEEIHDVHEIKNEKKIIKEDAPNIFIGVCASEGVAVGKTLQWRLPEIQVPEIDASPAEEKRKLEKARTNVLKNLKNLYEETLKKAGKEEAEIFKAHEELLNDPAIDEDMNTLIGKGKSASFAVKQVFDNQIKKIESLKSDVLIARANDWRDVEISLLKNLGVFTQKEQIFPEQTILLAEEMSASMAVSLEKGKIIGFATIKGGSSSHASILARALGIPSVAGLSRNILNIKDGETCLLDGTHGKLELNPDQQIVETVRMQEEQQRQLHKKEQTTALLPAVTLDGLSIEVAGNIAGENELDALIANGGAGVGLLRSEFLFSDRTTAPTEEEQTLIYKKIAKKLGKERFLVIRTLDAGGDKPLSYLNMEKEDNPFLGVRGIRLSLERKEVFRTQLRAILKSSDKTQIKIMFPMISSVKELTTAQKILNEEAEILQIEPPATGMMIEVPSVAIMADVFAKKTDFFSIGTNDLSQYVMAADRSNASVSSLADAFQPSVLRLIKSSVVASSKNGKELSVCGNLAGDVKAVPLLIGLGVRKLSVAVPLIPKIKSTVRLLDMKKCRCLADEVLLLSSVREVHEKLNAFYQEITEKE